MAPRRLLEDAKAVETINCVLDYTRLRKHEAALVREVQSVMSGKKNRLTSVLSGRCRWDGLQSILMGNQGFVLGLAEKRLPIFKFGDRENHRGHDHRNVKRIRHGRSIRSVRLLAQTTERTTPPSTRSAAPLVAEASGLHT